MDKSLEKVLFFPTEEKRISPDSKIYQLISKVTWKDRILIKNFKKIFKYQNFRPSQVHYTPIVVH